jgi:DNA-binding NtrC family response regulator
MLRSLGHIIEAATDNRMAVELIAANNIDLVLSEVDPLESDATILPARGQRNHRGVPFILSFSRPDAKKAKASLRSGAAGVVNYPVSTGKRRVLVLQGLKLIEGTAPMGVVQRPYAAIAHAQERIEGRTLEKALEESGRRIIMRTLPSSHENRQKTAAALNVNRATLYK